VCRVSVEAHPQQEHTCWSRFAFEVGGSTSGGGLREGLRFIAMCPTSD
jgi:hypothetical protein